MNRISPHTYCYLRHPLLCSGEILFYRTVQHMCFTGAIHVRYDDVRAGLDKDRVVRRLYLRRGVLGTSASPSERFAWNLFPKSKQLTLTDLKRLLHEEFADPAHYKYDVLFPELQSAGLLASRHWRTSEGRKAYSQTRDTLFTVGRDIGRSLPGGWDRSLKHLQDLGSCIVLLNDATQKMLIAASSRKRDLIAVFSIISHLHLSDETSLDPVSVIGTHTTAGDSGIGGSNGGPRSTSGSGGFGGFGGGSFGGSGAGGSW